MIVLFRNDVLRPPTNLVDLIYILTNVAIRLFCPFNLANVSCRRPLLR